jgi:hypothetical protein
MIRALIMEIRRVNASNLNVFGVQIEHKQRWALKNTEVSEISVGSPGDLVTQFVNRIVAVGVPKETAAFGRPLID